MTKIYRKGPIGALMDEYERATFEFARLIERIPGDEYARLADPQTKDENCRSVQTITSHVVNAGYAYADYIRTWYSVASERPPKQQLTQTRALEELEAMLSYTARTLEGKWEIAYEEIMETSIRSNWGITYDVEQLLEHAIVHVLRHRRQVEKFIAQGAIASP